MLPAAFAPEVNPGWRHIGVNMEDGRLFRKMHGGLALAGGRVCVRNG